MTPEEIESIIEAMKPICALCATVLVKPFDMFCPTCEAYDGGRPHEQTKSITAATFAIMLGLTKGVRDETLLDASLEFDSELERQQALEILTSRFRKFTVARQRMLWARFSALYLPALADDFVAPRSPPSIHRFGSIIHMLSCIEDEPIFAKFFLSNDPRARAGNGMAKAIAEQMIMHAPSWERQLQFKGSNSSLLTCMGSACVLVMDILMLQVDKSEALSLPEDLRKNLITTTERWLHKGDEALDSAVQAMVIFVRGGFGRDSMARQRRDELEGLQTCGKYPCGRRDNLFLCSRCGAVTYCGRQHQREDWDQEPLGHKQVCYRSFF